MPVIIMRFFLCSSHFSFSFSLYFIGNKYGIIMVLLRWNIILILLIRIICFLRGAYSLYLFSIVGHREIFSIVKNGFNGNY